MMTHPPTLLRLVERTLRATCVRDAQILIAVSGGPDSMALLHALSKFRQKFRLGLVAHGVDHGLREAASCELDRAQAFADELGIPWGQTRIELGRGSNLQARARQRRYRALREAAQSANCSLIATGHHADDRAETVLIRLLRGANPHGLGVLPAREGDLLRPMIHAPHAAIKLHIQRHAIPFALDPSNLDPRFVRTRVRRDVLPLLAELNPKIVAHLCSLADEVRALTHLPASTGEDGEDGAASHIVSNPARLPRPTRLALAHLEASRSPKARVSLPGGLVARFDQAQLKVVVFVPNGAPNSQFKHPNESLRHSSRNTSRNTSRKP